MVTFVISKLYAQRTCVRAANTCAPHHILVPQTILNPSSGLYLGWSWLAQWDRLSGLVGTCIWVGAGWDLGSFHRASEHKADVPEYFKAKIVGYTTPALQDVGGASIRIQFDHEFELNSGGFKRNPLLNSGG